MLIEDTSLDVEGADVGVNVRWIMENLKTLAGKKAIWRVLLGILREDNKVYVYQGMTEGKIVTPRGDSAFGFDPVFEPTGSSKTLAEAKPDEVNARCKAVQALISGKYASLHDPIEKDQWKGKWQEH